MSKIQIFLLTMILTLLATSCAPQLIPSTPPTSPTEEPGIPVTGVANVQSLEIQIVEAQPLQINAILRGQLPDAGCTTISSVTQVRNGNTIQLSLLTTSSPLALCAQVLTPFERVVALDMSNLSPGQYKVHVNNIEQAFKLPARDVLQFKPLLVEALNGRDYEGMKGMMDQSFLIAYWQSEGTENTPDAAIEQLRLNLLNSASPITADYSKNLIELLGSDPVMILGPEVIEASPLLTSGWGPAGKDQAILFVAKQPNGDVYWHGLLFARDGFAKPEPVVTPPPPVDVNGYPTNVKYVQAQEDVNIRSGPGMQFNILSYLAAGQTAKVTGVSADGNWWRVLCPDNSVGSCWVSAAWNLTRPTDGIVTNPPVDIIGKADVQGIDIQILEDDPLQVDVIARGRLPNAGCTKLLDAIQSREGNMFYVTLRTKTDPMALCPPVFSRFEYVIPLQVGDLEPARYIVNVNGVEEEFDLIDTVYPTEVEYVIAKQDLTIHSGPRKRFSVIGHIAAGQTVKVTGVNDNKKWWRVICPDNSVGSCWISADPNLTAPTGRPANADVQNVEIRLLESYPVQVQAVARGLLPDAGCTTILGASQKRGGNIFTVTINTTVDPQALCAPALTPFEQVIPLEVDSLLPGPYIVRVNSVEAGFELPAAQPIQ